jgi:excisionase family DNA binding protein
MSRLYTLGEVADVLRVSRGTVLWWCSKGYIEFTRRPSGHRRFAESEVFRIRSTHRPGQRWAK